MIRWIPNALTASRGLIGLAVAALLAGPGPARLGFWLFVFAMLTDLVDGWLARRLGATSDVGEWLDPLSDKVLTDACWIGLWASGWAPWWLAGGMLLRDGLVVLGYLLTLRTGRRFRANLAGRLMVSFEGVAVAVLLFHGPWLGVDWPTVGVALGILTLVLSLASVGGYLVRGPVATQRHASE